MVPNHPGLMVVRQDTVNLPQGQTMHYQGPGGPFGQTVTAVSVASSGGAPPGRLSYKRGDEQETGQTTQQGINKSSSQPVFTANTYKMHQTKDGGSTTYTNAPVGSTTVTAAGTKFVNGSTGSSGGEITERVQKMEVLLNKKQREIDDLLLRIFLVAAENDRLRNEDQLLHNIKALKNNPLLQKSLQQNEKNYAND